MKQRHIGLILVALFATVLLTFCLAACGVTDTTAPLTSSTAVESSKTETSNSSTTLISTSTEAPISSIIVITSITETPNDTSDTPITSTEAPITTVPVTEDEHPEAFIIYSIEMTGRYGDATLIKYGDYEILVDGGTSSDAANVQKALEKHVTDKHLDMLIVSHPDADHIDGLEKLSTFSSIDSIGMIVQNGDTRGSDVFNNTIVKHFASAESKSIVEIMADETLRQIEVDEDFSITFLDQANYYSSSASKNNKSIAFIVKFENTVLFMGGDMETNACNSLMEKNPDLTTDEQFVIFKALHHGSKGTNSAKFLSYIKPDLAFVGAGMQLASDGTPNYSSHPYPEAVARIAVHTTRVYWSSLIGNTTITCDGEDATVMSEGRSKDYYYQTKSQTGTILAKRDEEIGIVIFATCYYRMAIEYHGYTDHLGILQP